MKLVSIRSLFSNYTRQICEHSLKFRVFFVQSLPVPGQESIKKWKQEYALNVKLTSCLFIMKIVCLDTVPYRQSRSYLQQIFPCFF